MNVSVRSFTFYLIIAASACSWGQVRPFSFDRHVIDDEFTGGYQVKAADVDEDGDLDVIALSTNPTALVWYANPTWKAHHIPTSFGSHIDAAPHDIDGDGDIDLALASEFNLRDSTQGGVLHWLECPDDPANGGAWAAHLIGSIPTSHRIRWADLDADRKPELLNLPIIGRGASAPEYRGGVDFTAYRIPPNPKADPWVSVVLDKSLEVAHGMLVTTWHAKQVVLTASSAGVHLFRARVGSHEFEKVHLGSGQEGNRPQRGSSEIAKGLLGKSTAQVFLAAIEPWHGNRVVTYHGERLDSGLWSRYVVDDSLVDGHALACADFDGDGADEIIAGQRGGGRKLYVYGRGEDGWQRTTVDDGGVGAAGVEVCDINGDGRVDIVATGTATGNVVWYENVTRNRP